MSINYLRIPVPKTLYLMMYGMLFVVNKSSTPEVLGGHRQLCTMGTKISSTMARCHIISSQRPTLQPLS